MSRVTVDYRLTVANKRDGRTLSDQEIRDFVAAYTRGDISDALAASFLMAVVLNGLGQAETLALTRALVESGATVEFGDLGAPVVDKHSTGGVADSVTLVFAPLAAALGLSVAKLSGRGLGHTGGTLDKLESIPGFRTDLGPDQIAEQAARVGCVVAAQTTDLVPADGKLYALRDATATVPAISLIAASVMSKKLAVGTDAILLDVKAGSGAFMKSVEEAERLAEACLLLAEGWGRRTWVAVTDMSQPLGEAIGNALDVAEAVAVLSGQRKGRLVNLAVAFAARGLQAVGSTSLQEGLDRARAALGNGTALERFRAMVEAQGGDGRVVDDPMKVLPRAPKVLDLRADRSGVLREVDAEALGLASGALGAGRLRKEDVIDPSVGIVFVPKIGDQILTHDVIGQVHARTEEDAHTAIARVRSAIDIADEPVESPPLVHRWFGPPEAQ